MENENNTIDNEDEISLLELWNIFKNRFAYFLVTLIVVVVVAFAYLQQTVPKYSSSVTVLVDPIESSSSLDDMLLSGVSSSTSKIQTEVELITSKRNIQNALDSLDLSQYKNSKGESYDTFYKLSSKSDAISVTTVQDTNLVTITITDENPQFATDLANALSSNYDMLLTGIAKTSKTTQREFLEEQIPKNEEELQLAADKLSDYKEESGVMQLTEKASTLVSQITYFDVKEEPLKLNKINNNELLSKYKEQLAEYSVVLPTVDELSNVPALQEYSKSYSSANTELLMYNLAYATGSSTTGTSTVSGDSTRTSNLISTKNSASNKMLDLINLQLMKYSDGDAYTNKIIVEYGKAALEIIKDDIELQALEERSKVYNDELDQLPLIERKVTDLERNVTVLQTVGVDLRSMLEQVKLTEAAVSGNVTVIDAAILPLIPVSPNKLLIMAVAVLLGMALGFLMCIIANIRDNALNTREDVKKIVGSEIPLLGWIPLIEEEEVKSEEEKAKKIKHPAIYVYNNPTALESEKYMSITSNLIYGKNLINNQVISITSCDVSSGKSTIISNIGMCLAQMGSKVIIIDGDFRMPSVLSRFGYTKSKIGMVEVILGKKKLEEVIVQPIDNVPTLNVLPVGHRPQVPSSILAHPLIKDMMDVLRANYDYILIDAPPIDYAAEVIAIGKMSDTVLLNTRFAVTTKDELKELLENLNVVHDRIGGVIFNGFVPSTGDHGSFGGKYGYGYGYGKSSYSYGYDAYTDGKKRKVKYMSKSKAKRLANKKYKANLAERGKRDAFFSSQKKYAPVKNTLNLSEEASTASEYFQKVVADALQYSKVNFNSTGEKVNENLSYDSILDDLENDRDAFGKNPKE